VTNPARVALVEDLDNLLGIFDTQLKGLEISAHQAALEYVRSGKEDDRAAAKSAIDLADTVKWLKEGVANSVRILSPDELHRLTRDGGAP
jgi:hypothetical protein